MNTNNVLSGALAVLIALATGSFAQADIFDHFGISTMTKMGATQEVGAVFRVVGKIKGSEDPYEQFYFGKFDLSFGTSDSDELEYADLQLVVFSQGEQFSESWWTADWIPIKYKRDLAIDQDSYISISVVELSGGFHPEIGSTGMHWVLEGALDILGYGYTKRASDGTSDDGWHSSIEAKIGIQNDRFRLVFGGAVHQVISDREYTGSTYDCYDAYDEYGHYIVCDENRHYDSDYRAWSEVFLRARYNATDQLHFFAEAGYYAYHVSNDISDVPDSDDDVFRLMFGAIYTPNPSVPTKHRPWRGLE